MSNVFYINEPFWTVDTMFYTEMKYDSIAKYVYFVLIAKDLVSMNAGSAVPSMTTEILNGLPVIIPSIQVLEHYNTVVSPLFQAIDANKKSNETLSQLRDTLLPKLMSGELSVAEAGAMI